MSLIGNQAKKVIDLVSPDRSRDRLVFRRFKGAALAEAAQNDTDIKNSDVETVILKVNPQEINYTEPKIVQKIQTNAPGRFVVFDWGTDLTQIAISGTTGMMLPTIMQSGNNLLANTMIDVGEKLGSWGGDIVKKGTDIQRGGLSKGLNDARFIMQKSMTFDEIINLSPKYKTFMKLKHMYEIFDADFDILTLEIGETIYRGYFIEFSFTQTADSPWNWRYQISFISLENLTSMIQRSDQSFNRSNIFD